MTMITTVKHADFCQPRVGETEPRMESFTVARYDPSGTKVIGRPRIDRCVECGEQTVTG